MMGMEEQAGTDLNLLRQSVQLKRLWPYFGQDKRWIVVAAGLVPVIALASTLPAVVLKYAIDQGVVAGNAEVVVRGGVFYLGVVLLNYFTQTAQAFLSGYAVQGMATRLRSRLVHHVLTRPLTFHDRNLSGALVTRATGDFENLAQSLNQGILTSIADLAKLLGIIGGMFYLGWVFGVVSVLVIGLGAFVVNAFSVRLRDAMAQSRRHSSRMNAFAQEILYNNVTIKHLSAERTAAARFDELNELNRSSQMREVTHDANLFSFLDGLSSICIGGALFLVLSLQGGEAGSNFGMGAVTAGTLVAFVQYMFQLFEPLKMLGNKIAMLQGVFTAIERIFGILDVTESIEGDRKIERLSGHLTVSDLVYRYAQDLSSPPILNRVSFSLAAGESLAIVGRTGSGKSTIIRLLTKLYGGYEGSVRFDDLELRDLDALSLRKHIAVVSQDVALFNETIAFNVGLGDPHVTLADVEAACCLAGADRFIQELPGRYDFLVSEKGENLSQGQRQLLSLARALVHKPRFLILDEATSSVDPQSEAIFQRAVDRILGQCTVIIVAHRLETIARCNWVMVLEAGSVIEWGTYAELMQRQGPFWRLKRGGSEA
jgi:ATP-binding cassette subfamily B multidrug efflux pump